MPAITSTVILLGYFTCERPGMPALFRPDGTLLSPQYGDWEHVMWGEPGKPGRIPTAILTAQRFSADKIMYVGGGAQFASGQTEPDWVQQYIRENVPRLARDFPRHFFDEWEDADQSCLWLTSMWDTEHGGHNTATSLKAAAPRIVSSAAGASFTVFVVTSANHIQRSLRDAIVAFDAVDDDNRHRGLITGVAASTAYGGGNAAHVKVDDLGKGEFRHWVKPTK